MFHLYLITLDRDLAVIIKGDSCNTSESYSCERCHDNMQMNPTNNSCITERVLFGSFMEMIAFCKFSSLPLKCNFTAKLYKSPKRTSSFFNNIVLDTVSCIDTVIAHSCPSISCVWSQADGKYG